MRGISTKYILLLTLLLISGAFIISGFTDIMGTNSTAKTSTGGTFENEWIKFQYPPELVILDNSNSTRCSVEIYNNSNTIIENQVGELFYYKTNKTDLVSFTKAKRITMAGKSGIKIEDGLQVCSYVFLTSGDIDVKTMVLNFDAHKYRDTYQKVSDTIVVKKIPN